MLQIQVWQPKDDNTPFFYWIQLGHDAICGIYKAYFKVQWNADMLKIVINLLFHHSIAVLAIWDNFSYGSLFMMSKDFVVVD